MISAIFDLQVILILPINFLVKSVGLLVLKKLKSDFQDGAHGSHLGFLIGMILATFDLQVAPILPSKFRVN